MGIFSRLLGRASPAEVQGARLEDRHPWVVPSTRDAAGFLRALPALFPDGGFVYFEDTTERLFASWAQGHAVESPLTIASGTIWPRPDWFHIPLDSSLLEQAATLIERQRIVLPSIHVHVHNGITVLLEWHDAFVNEPIYITSEIPRERVYAFANHLQVAPVTREGAL